MAKIIQEKNLIKIGKELFVVLPLKKWEEIKGILEDLEDNIRYYRAISDPENRKCISFEKAKRMLNLP